MDREDALHSKLVQQLIGSLFILGFEGTEVTPQIKALIETHHVGSICISAKNLVDARQATELIGSLQQLAYNAGHQQPLLISLDQENGLVNSIFDSDYITQFPSAMAIAASKSPHIAKAVATATAKELSCLGVNLILGPVLDVHARGQAQQMGVRSLGEDNHVVSDLGLEYVKGYHSGGLLCCGKHFPGYGDLMFPGNLSDIPSVPGTLDQLYYSSLGPFQIAVDNDLDSILVGACAMPDVEYENVLHACLSRHVVTNLLRERLGFKGVILCECLEIESMYESFGVGQASVMAVDAGCDLLMVCNSYINQQEAILAVQAAVASGVISEARILESVNRINMMKRKYLSWDTALNSKGVQGLGLLRKDHATLSVKAYENSITLIRDRARTIPLSIKVDSSAKLLLLTPLVETFHGAQSPRATEDEPTPRMKGSHASTRSGPYRAESPGNLDGEAAFQSFGRSLAKLWPGKVVHTSYTASGVSPLHEKLVSEAAVVVLLTADGFRNTYQYGFTKYVLTLCRSQSSLANSQKPCAVVAVSSPYDFYNDPTVPTYLCTYDCTDVALACLSRTLFGTLDPARITDTSPDSQPLPGNGRMSVQRQLWLVEDFLPARDLEGLQGLLDRTQSSSSDRAEMVEAHFPTCCFRSSSYTTDFEPLINSHHFVVRNSSTMVIYGFCATYYIASLGLGSVGLILVDLEKRQKGIGFSLHQRATSYLRALPGLKHLQLGTTLPSIYPGIPNRLNPTHVVLRKWVKAKGWSFQDWNRTAIFMIRSFSLDAWTVSMGVRTKLFARHEMVDSQQSPANELLRRHLTKAQPYAAPGRAMTQTAIIRDMYLDTQQASPNNSIVMVKERASDAVVGSAILYHPDSILGGLFPLESDRVGGVSAIMISDSRQPELIAQALLVSAAERLREQGFGGCGVFLADQEPQRRLLEDIGFQKLYEFLGMEQKV